MEAEISEPAERLSADDEDARERILSIDLSVYDKLVTYPAGVDWARERKKILFLQTALRLDFPWKDIVRCTAPHFGQTLHSPFVPIVKPILPQPFHAPAFDIARQTVGQWTSEADKAWKAYRNYEASGLRESRQQLIQRGLLSEFERPRCSTGIKGQAKARIFDDKTAYDYAALYFFAAQLGKPLTWVELARGLTIRKPEGSIPERTKLKRKLAEQIRTNVIKVFVDVGLPLPD